MDVYESYQSSFAALAQRTAAAPAWLRELRETAWESFRAVGFPSTRVESWKYTNVAPLLRAPFAPIPTYESNGVGAAQVSNLALGTLPGIRVVLIDGHFVAALSDLSSCPAGVEVTSLASAMAADASGLQDHLGHYAGFKDGGDGFVALNSAFLNDGAVVRIGRGVIVDEPIHIVHLTTAHAERTAAYPRTLVLADEASQATIVESHVAVGSGAYLADAVTEIVAAPSAVVEHVGVVMANDAGLHVGTVAVQQGRASHVTLHSFAVKGGTIRNDVRVVLDGEGAESTLNGLFTGSGGAHIDSFTMVDHAKPSCSSQELYKGILADSSVGIFNGLILVRPQAQKTVARQASKNLLLSKDAQVNSKPQLEIHADDVKCNHGSTIGQLDEDSVFYLRSRGIGLVDALDLLTYAFAAEMVGRVGSEPVRSSLETLLRAHLPQRG